jgi:UDP-2,3-diacylglucosamine pyrophosphatase LpxH
MKRKIEIVILSDTHLGTFGCHAKELLSYLRSIEPEMLILNGDFIDIWQFSKIYFPKSHLAVIHEVMKMALSGTKVYYITGNHDDMLRKFSDFSSGNIHLRDKLVLQMKGEKYWIFHGDVFDVSIKHTKWLAKMGANGYGLLILLNRLVNRFRRGLGMSRMSFAGKIKSSIKKAVKYVDDFETTAINLAFENNYDYVVCGHIHKPVIKQETKNNKTLTYMNSGDWMENLTTLEYNFNKWVIYKYDDLDYQKINRRLRIRENDEFEIEPSLYSKVTDFKNIHRI